MSAPSEDEPSDPTSGLYPISTVAERTGLTPEMLRQWENRYGFPEPERTKGGHRRYSEREVQALVTIQRWIDEGATASAAIERYRTGAPRIAGETTLLAERMAQAMLGREVSRMDEILGRAMAVHPLATVLDEVLAPAMARVGEAWAAGEATVADEHLVTTFVRGKLEELLASYPRGEAPSVALTTPPGERHEIGALGLAVLLRQRGLKATFLGANIPMQDLRGFADEMSVDLVGLSAPQVDPLHEIPESGLEDVAPEVVVGGRAAREVPERVRELGARPLGGNLSAAVGEIRALLRE